MTNPHPLPPEYVALATERATARPRDHKQPEEFGYDFREWVSPYTKGAHFCGGFALVLQDWASTEGLEAGFDQEIQRHGRDVSLRTNVRLEQLLSSVLGVSLSEVYATNAFPFIKKGAMDARLRLREVVDTVRAFTVKELTIARPTVILALGAMSYLALQRAGISCVRLPHPAARIGGIAAHEHAWRKALSTAHIDVRPPQNAQNGGDVQSNNALP